MVLSMKHTPRESSSYLYEGGESPCNWYPKRGKRIAFINPTGESRVLGGWEAGCAGFKLSVWSGIDDMVPNLV
jgi:hypothetical protein